MSVGGGDGTGAGGGWPGLLLGALLLLGGCAPGGEGPEEEARHAERPPPAGTAEAEEPTYQFFVRVEPEADPAAVAADHGLRPDTAPDAPDRAFRASFTKAVASRLREDPRVRSVSVRVEEEGWRPPEGRTVPGDSSPDSSAAGR